MPALLAFAPVLSKGLFMVLEWLGTRGPKKEAREKAFAEMAKLMRENGIANVRSRYEAEEQIKEGDDIWNDREKQTPPPAPPEVPQ